MSKLHCNVTDRSYDDYDILSHNATQVHRFAMRAEVGIPTEGFIVQLQLFSHFTGL